MRSQWETLARRGQAEEGGKPSGHSDGRRRPEDSSSERGVAVRRPEDSGSERGVAVSPGEATGGLQVDLLTARRGGPEIPTQSSLDVMLGTRARPTWEKEQG